MRVMRQLVFGVSLPAVELRPQLYFFFFFFLYSMSVAQLCLSDFHFPTLLSPSHPSFSGQSQGGSRSIHFYSPLAPSPPRHHVYSSLITSFIISPSPAGGNAEPLVSLAELLRHTSHRPPVYSAAGKPEMCWNVGVLDDFRKHPELFNSLTVVKSYIEERDTGRV